MNADANYTLDDTLEAARANCAEARRVYSCSTGAKRARAFDDLQTWEAKAATLSTEAMRVALVTIAAQAPETVPHSLAHSLVAIARRTLDRVQA